MCKVKVGDVDAREQLSQTLIKTIDENSIIICIGTDRCIGDSLGPLVGTLLKKENFPIPVYGTLDEPIHALNIENKLYEIKNLHPQQKIIGIDACLGDKETIGEILFRNKPICPGKGVGKTLPDVGDVSLIGIVDSSDNSEFFSWRNSIRLSMIWEMAELIKSSLEIAITEIEE